MTETTEPTETGAPRRTYSCEDCGRWHDTPRALAQHRRWHHPVTRPAPAFVQYNVPLARAGQVAGVRVPDGMTYRDWAALALWAECVRDLWEQSEPAPDPTPTPEPAHAR
jgi:hypothetical protein